MTANAPTRRRSAASRVLIYYFGFPHYREEILKSLQLRSDVDAVLLSGTASKASIATLSETELPDMKVVPTVKLGNATWDRGAFWQGLSRRWDAVILGPATTSLSTWAILAVRRLLRRHTYLWGQCGRPGDKSLKRLVQEIMNRLASGLLVYGHAEASAATELGMNPSKVHVVNNATQSNTSMLSSAESATVLAHAQEMARQALRSGELRLAYVGRLVSAKRPEVLLQAARKLREEFPRLIVDIVGGGKEAERLHREYPEDFIRFRGWLYPGLERDAVFTNATLIVSPYHMGLLAIDALRFGVPVLVPDNEKNASEVEALTLDVNSLAFRAGDPDALVDAVRRWLNLAPQIGSEQFNEARTRALSIWSPEAVAQRIIDVVSNGTSSR